MAQFLSSGNESDSLSSNESFLFSIEESQVSIEESHVTIDNNTMSPDWTTLSAAKALFVETTVEKFLLKFILPAIIFVGTVGNILSIAVLIRSKMRSTSDR